MENYSIGYDLANGPDRTAVYFWRGDEPMAPEPPDPPRNYIDECVTLTAKDFWRIMRAVMPRPGVRFRWDGWHRCRRGRWWWK